jgi:hypothetical protein
MELKIEQAKTQSKTHEKTGTIFTYKNVNR